MAFSCGGPKAPARRLLVPYPRSPSAACVPSATAFACGVDLVGPSSLVTLLENLRPVAVLRQGAAPNQSAFENTARASTGPATSPRARIHPQSRS